MTLPMVLTADALPYLDPALVIATMRDAFMSLGHERAIQPAQSVTPLDNGGDIISYPAVMLDSDVFSMKFSPYIPQAGGGAVVTAWTLLLNTRTGAAIALVNSKSLTTLRTAATTALAVDLLATPDATSLAIVGAGPVALAHLAYLRTVRPFTKVRLFSRREVDLDLPGVELVRSMDAVLDSEVIALCTSAAEPVIDVGRARPGALITSISTNAPGAREIDHNLLRDLDVYCDHSASIPAIAEFGLAVGSKQWSYDDVLGDLPMLLTDSAPLPTRTRPVFFRSIGLGLEDAAIARLAVSRAS